MEKNVTTNAKRTAVKISLLAAISLLLLLPLCVVMYLTANMNQKEYIKTEKRQ